MIAAIHQPNFLPWMGYFHKIARADVFVLLDVAAFSKGSWTNRVRMLVSGQPRWVTCPVLHKLGQRICDVRINNHQPWQTKLVKTLEQNYGQAEHFRSVMEWVEPILRRPTDLLAEFNVPCIVQIARRLGLETRLVRQSELAAPDERTQNASGTLADICRRLGAETYLAGQGAEGYEDRTPYEEAGIRLVKSDFRSASYPQTGSKEFVPGLSILDALFNRGLDTVRSLLIC